MMHGRLSVESEVGKGTKFRFTAMLGLAAKPVERRIPAPQADWRQLPVLIVDDNATNRRILEETLSRWHMDAQAVQSGAEALDQMRRRISNRGRPFQLVLVDVCMPGMDGFALAEHIKADPALRTATILMLTSANRSEDMARCQQLDVAAYLVKPIRISSLFDAVATTLGAPSNVDSRQRVAPAAHGHAAQRLRVLLTEDNVVNQKVARRMLEKRGHDVVIANNGREAIEAIDRESFDVVLMDVQMPEMGGFEATAAIREKEKGTDRHLRIVAMTAHAMTGDRDRCLAIGMDAYVSKPIAPQKLFQTIEENAPASKTAATGPRDSSSDPGEILDVSSLMKHLDADPELVEAVRQEFLQQAPLLVDTIRETLASRDQTALEFAVHSLKNTLSHVASAQAYKTVVRLERSVRTGDLADAGQALPVLAEQLRQLRLALAEIVAETPS
jgi:CheY-like chemotaxis protein